MPKDTTRTHNLTYTRNWKQRNHYPSTRQGRIVWSIRRRIDDRTRQTTVDKTAAAD